MGFIDKFINREPVKVEKEVKQPMSSNMGAFNIDLNNSTPIQNYNKSRYGYLFGDGGLYPQELNNLYNTSPLQNNIINFKSLLTTGNGYEIIGGGETAMDKVVLNQLLLQMDKIIPEITSDFFVHSRIALKVTWNADNTKLLKVEALPADSVRILTISTEMKPLSFVYNFDWEFPSKFETVEYPAFNQQNKEEKVQIFMYQKTSPGMKIYSLPSYQSCIKWVNLDAEMAVYHNSNIENSLNPSMLIQYYEKPGSDEEKHAVLQGINGSFSGSKKTGRAMVTFADSVETSPTVSQMEPNKLDATFLNLTDTIQRQICYSHSVDPLILGLKTPGSLGNSGEFEYAFNLFNQSTVQPSQLIIEGILNEILAINGLGTKLKFNDPSIVTPEFQENNVIINQSK